MYYCTVHVHYVLIINYCTVFDVQCIIYSTCTVASYVQQCAARFIYIILYSTCTYIYCRKTPCSEPGRGTSTTYTQPQLLRILLQYVRVQLASHLLNYSTCTYVHRHIACRAHLEILPYCRKPPGQDTPGKGCEPQAQQLLYVRVQPPSSIQYRYNQEGLLRLLTQREALTFECYAEMFHHKDPR